MRPEPLQQAWRTALVSTLVLAFVSLVSGGSSVHAEEPIQLRLPAQYLAEAWDENEGLQQEVSGLLAVPWSFGIYTVEPSVVREPLWSQSVTLLNPFWLTSTVPLS
jgi:hypothetical protein